MEEKYKSYNISYNEVNEKFVVSIGESTYKNSSLIGVKKYLDNLDKKDFKRVDVIYDDYENYREAVVTSIPDKQLYASDQFRDCWISFKDSDRGYDSCRKVAIERLILDTPDNRKIIDSILEKQEHIKKKNQEITELGKTFDFYKT